MDMLNLPHLAVQEGLQFVCVPATELPNHWTWILKGLAEVKRRIGERNVNYTPAHVRNSIIQQQSYLYVVTDDGVPVAFTVLTVQSDPFLNVPTVLHVWVIYAEPGHLDAVRHLAAEVCSLGRKLCLERVHYLSPRGNEAVWRRLFAQKGYATMTSYEVILFEEES